MRLAMAIFISSAMVAGCSKGGTEAGTGGSNETPPVVSTAAGRFIDAPVEGVSYASGAGGALPVPPTYTINAAVLENRGGNAIPGATVTLTDSVGRITQAVTDEYGMVRFRGLGDGTYSLAPSKAGYSFSTLSPWNEPHYPPPYNVTVNGKTPPYTSFYGRAGYSIKGKLLLHDGRPACGNVVDAIFLNNPQGTLIDSSTCFRGGEYYLYGIPNGSYYITPVLDSSVSGISFNPTGSNSMDFTMAGSSYEQYNLYGTEWSGRTIAGKVRNSSGTGVPFALVYLTPNSGRTTSIKSDPWGNYKFKSLTNGTYTVSAGSGYTPASRTVTLNNSNGTAEFVKN